MKVTDSRFYNTWRTIKKRCSPNAKIYSGASCCIQWDDFREFEKWSEENFKENRELVCLDSKKFYSPETCKYLTRAESQKFHQVKEKRGKTNLKKYGTEHYAQTKEFSDNFKPVHTQESLEKRRKTCLEKYGTNNVSKNKIIQEKIEKTNLDKYGVNCVFKNEKIKDKIKETNQKNFGVDYPTQSQEIKDKVVATNLDKFGKDYYTQTEEYKSRAKETSINKYGVEHHTQREEYKVEMRDRLKERKIYKLYNGKLLSELCEEANITRDPMSKRIKKYGLDLALKMKKKESGLELFFENDILIKNGIKYSKQFSVKNFIADFKIDNLLVECDGLYWHSEAHRHKNYHKEKMYGYAESGFSSLFFYEDEIINKTNIVESILLNKLGKSQRIFARKCIIKPVDTITANTFFEENHLMGKGSGKAFGLYLNNELVSCIRIKKIQNGLDISRFCHKIGYNTIGGYSKLIKHVEIKLSPKFIQTFIDLRYGSGEYLKDLGFEKSTESLSFCWIKGLNRIHRLNYKSNTGYDNGCIKLWDCGQRKFIKQLKQV